jgi:hypothetical protein
MICDRCQALGIFGRSGVTRPRGVDLFAGAGGCSVGYARAGIEMIGVDEIPHPDYPFELIVADAMTFPLGGFDFAHGSPPCPRWSRSTPAHTRESHPDLIAPLRDRLRAHGIPYVIENVPGAPLIDPIRLCGSSFGLHVRRHRLFESNLPLMSLSCAHRGQPIGVYGDHPDRNGAVPRPNGKSRGVKASSVAEAQRVLGIDWMTEWDDLTDAIPPIFTQFIGEQIITHLEAVAA